MTCDPRLGKMLVLSTMFRCALPMLSIAACLTKDPFHNSLQNRAQVHKVRCSHTILILYSLKIKRICLLTHNIPILIQPSVLWLCRQKRLLATPATVTTWCSVELCQAGGEFSRRAAERTETNIWKNTLCQGPAFDTSMVSLKHQSRCPTKTIKHIKWLI